LLDDEDGLSPHDWNERQFKSDQDQTATERKRAQRRREKQGNVTDDVTRDTHVTSHPPDTEQNRADHNTQDARVSEEEPEHTREVQEYLDNRADDLNAWDQDFLISIKWFPVLTKKQAEKLQAIRDKLRIVPAEKELPSVKRGTPAYDAWIAYYRRTGRPTAFYERQDAFTVLSEFPPQEAAA